MLLRVGLRLSVVYRGSLFLTCLSFMNRMLTLQEDAEKVRWNRNKMERKGSKHFVGG